MHASAIDVVFNRLPDDGPLLVDASTADDPRLNGRHLVGLDDARAMHGGLAGLPTDGYAAAVLLDDAVSKAGDHAEGVVDALGTAVRPGGPLALTLRNRVYREAAERGGARHPGAGAVDEARGFSSVEASALLRHRGCTIEVLCAPGAAARLRGDEGFDLDADRQPGLLDAAPRLLVIARTPVDEAERTRVFLDSRPRKIAAAATICRDADGRVLIVHDRFKGQWTLPGGVVDADEDPTDAARRETWEEAGVEADIGPILGVFVGRWPDRLVFVFAAQPTRAVERPRPVHTHEIADAAWVDVDAAVDRLWTPMVRRLRRCLERPGFTWTE